MRAKMCCVWGGVLAMGCAAADAGVDALNIILADGYQLSYTVPAGKALVIHHVIRTDSNRTVTCAAYSTNHVVVWLFDLAKGPEERTSFSPPVVVAESNSVNYPWTTGRALIFAYLVDKTDLYAAIGSKFTGAGYAATDNRLNVLLEVASPRPASLKFETSSDLASWGEVADASVRRTGCGRFEAALPVRRNTAFYRASARAKE